MDPYWPGAPSSCLPPMLTSMGCLGVNCTKREKKCFYANKNNKISDNGIMPIGLYEGEIGT